MAAEESKYTVVITPPVPGQRGVGERGFLAHSSGWGTWSQKRAAKSWGDSAETEGDYERDSRPLWKFPESGAWWAPTWLDQEKQSVVKARVPARVPQSEIKRKQKVTGLNQSQVRDDTRSRSTKRIDQLTNFFFCFFYFLIKYFSFKNIHSHYDTLEITTKVCSNDEFGDAFRAWSQKIVVIYHSTRPSSSFGVCLGVSKG